MLSADHKKFSWDGAHGCNFSLVSVIPSDNHFHIELTKKKHFYEWTNCVRRIGIVTGNKKIHFWQNDFSSKHLKRRNELINVRLAIFRSWKIWFTFCLFMRFFSCKTGAVSRNREFCGSKVVAWIETKTHNFFIWVFKNFIHFHDISQSSITIYLKHLMNVEI